MKRSITAAFLSLLLVLSSHGQTADPPPGYGVRPIPACTPANDVVFNESHIPEECKRPGTWGAAEACLNALVARHPTLFPGAVIGRQVDGAGMNLYAHGQGLATNSVVSLASVSKPLVNVGLVKLVQDHFASSACTPAITSRCVFPDKFETPLGDALRVLDAQRGTKVYTQWYNPETLAYGDASDQRDWKKALKIRHLAHMTSGFPPIDFTGYNFCPGGVCTDVQKFDETCNPDVAGSKCRYAFLYNQYLTKRGPAIPNGCRPRPASGPRLFHFSNYNDPNRLWRKFERRYSFEPGLLGECVLVENASGAAWVDGRTASESDVAKFYLGMPLLARPGERYFYSQPNLLVASFLIEAVSGQRFDDYLKAQLFTPLAMNDTSFVIRPGTTQYQRLVDLKRVPTTPVRALPDLAAPLQPDTIYGADKNWDEPRQAWNNRWPEGGGYSTAGDLLRFLRFIRTGKAPDGRVLLSPEWLRLVTTEVDDTLPPDDVRRTYGFRRPAPGVLAGNGYFGTHIKRDINRCVNHAVLMQMIIESPENPAPYDARLCDYQFDDVMYLRGALIRMIDGIPNPCDPASPLDP